MTSENTQDEISTYILLKIRTIFESVSLAVISSGEKTLKMPSEDENEVDFYWLFGHLLQNIIPNMVPLQLVPQVTPLALEKALSFLIFDHISPLAPSAESLIVKYSEKVDSKISISSQRLKSLDGSIRDCVKFCENGESLPMAEFTKLANSSLLSLGNHRSASFIKMVIFGAVKFQDPKIFLKFISHPMTTVREMAFSSLKNHLTEVTQEISDSGDSNRSEKIRFLVMKPVLEELVRHGLDDSSQIVKMNTSAILTTLITSKIMWKEDIVDLIYDGLENLMPFLEIFQDEDQLGVALREFIFNTRRSRINRLKSAVRMLLQRKRDIRRKVLLSSHDTFSACFEGKSSNFEVWF